MVVPQITYRVGVRAEVLLVVFFMQGYIMAVHHESVHNMDFDVVRSTQFQDDMSRGVRIYGRL